VSILLSEFVTHPDFPGWRAFLKHGRLEYVNSPAGYIQHAGWPAVQEGADQFRKVVQDMLDRREFASTLEGIFLPETDMLPG